MDDDDDDERRDLSWIIKAALRFTWCESVRLSFLVSVSSRRCWLRDSMVVVVVVVASADVKDVEDKDEKSKF